MNNNFDTNVAHDGSNTHGDRMPTNFNHSITNTRDRTYTSTSPSMTLLRVMRKKYSKQSTVTEQSKKAFYEQYINNNDYAFESEDKQYIYTFGIIDILTVFGYEKKMESLYKRG